MTGKVELLQTRGQIDDYRLRFLSPTLLLQALATGGVFVLNAGPGIGKTTAAIGTALEGLATGQFDKTVVAVGQRRLVVQYLVHRI